MRQRIPVKVAITSVNIPTLLIDAIDNLSINHFIARRRVIIRLMMYYPIYTVPQLIYNLADNIKQPKIYNNIKNLHGDYIATHVDRQIVDFLGKITDKPYILLRYTLSYMVDQINRGRKINIILSDNNPTLDNLEIISNDD